MGKARRKIRGEDRRIITMHTETIRVYEVIPLCNDDLLGLTDAAVEKLLETGVLKLSLSHGRYMLWDTRRRPRRYIGGVTEMSADIVSHPICTCRGAGHGDWRRAVEWHKGKRKRGRSPRRRHSRSGGSSSRAC